MPEGFQALNDALTRKLDAKKLSLLDVLSDTSRWIRWDRHFSPLSGHQGKLREQERRKILTAFAYGTATRCGFRQETNRAGRRANAGFMRWSLNRPKSV